MPAQDPPVKEFTARLRRIVAASDSDLNLADAVLAVAAREYPDLDAAACMDTLDRLAERVRGRLTDRAGGPAQALEQMTPEQMTPEQMTPEQMTLEQMTPEQMTPEQMTLEQMNRVLFEEEGFRGNEQDYFDPRNSFLNEVLARRLGIPITLSIVYLEIGWRLQLPLEGVSFPGHFLVRLPLDAGVVIVDPYHRGRSLGVAELLGLARATLGEPVAEERLEALLGGASKREIVARVLRNLKHIYRERGDLERTLGALDGLLAVVPDAIGDLLERADLHRELQWYRAALGDYERCLVQTDDAALHATVRARIAELSSLMGRLH